MKPLITATFAALVFAAPAAAQQADPHAGHAMQATPAAAQAPANDKIAPDVTRAPEALKSSPRHHEWASIPLPGSEHPLKAFVVYPERKEKAGVVIVIHENQGLNDWTRAVGDQLAKEGFIAIVPDFVSGFGPGGTEESRDIIRQVYSEKLNRDAIVARLDAARNYALKLPAANGKVGVVGFCWGGAASFNYAVAQPALDAAVVYYGTSPADPEAYAKISAPVLGLYAGDDARVNATIPRAEENMKKNGKTYETHVFEGAGHGFLRQQSGRDGANQKAADGAWPLTVEFFRKHLK